MFSANIASMNAHTNWLDNTARNVANVNTNGYSPNSTTINSNGSNPVATKTSEKYANNQEMSRTDLTKDITDMVVSSAGFSANAPAIRTEDEMLGTLLNIKA